MPEGKEKYIVVLGSLLSGIGKGIVSSSICKILSFHDLKILPLKFDGYLNYDCGTMNPLKHGEVFVLDDKSEVDMDFGTYERFMNTEMNGSLSLTGGKLFSEIISRERKGDYLGEDIQIIPHLTGLIQDKVRAAYRDNKLDVLLIEVGGTVGDIESGYFIEAMRELALKHDVIFVAVTYVPVIGVVGEQKTKPTQISMRSLMQIGVQPDFLVTRSEKELQDKTCNKIALFANLEPNRVIDNHDLESVYLVPEALMKKGLDTALLDELGFSGRAINTDLLERWNACIPDGQNLKKTKISVVGKYVKLHDSYASVREALMHAAHVNNLSVEIDWLESEELEGIDDGAIEERLRGSSGILVPGGFGNRGIEGMLRAIRYAREHSVPYLGICLGMQLMAIEFARNVAGLQDAHSTEFNPDSANPVISLMESQKGVEGKGGTMRLGAWPALLAEGSHARRIYGTDRISERHRHRYEFNNAYRDVLSSKGLKIGGTTPDGALVEFIEWSSSFGIATQAHPELKSRPESPAPLFGEFVKRSASRS